MKKIITVLLSAIMLVSFMGISAFATEEEISVNAVYFEKHLSTGYVRRDYLQTGAYRAIVNITNPAEETDSVQLMLAAFDSDERLYSISCQNVDVAEGSADYYTDDVAITKDELSQKFKVFVWGKNYEPLIAKPVVMENASCQAEITSAVISVTDGTTTMEWEGYVNDGDGEITFYPDTLAYKNRISSETDETFKAAATAAGVTSGHVVKANYKLDESFVDKFPSLLKSNATLTLNIENGSVISSPQNDFSNKNSYNYTIIDNAGRFKTYAIKVMESAVIRESNYDADAAIYQGLPNRDYDNTNYVGGWSRIGFSTTDYGTCGFTVTRENNMLRLNQTIDNAERGIYSLIGAEGYSTDVNRIVTSYDIQFASLTGNGLYIGGTGPSNTTYTDGRQALLYQPVTVNGENKIEVKYLRGLTTTYRHVAENSFSTPVYLDFNKKYEIDVIYKQLKDTGGYPCYAELYIDGKYIGSLGSGWQGSGMVMHTGNLVIDAFASDTYKTTYDVYLDNIGIDFIGNATYYLKDAALR